ncbi:MAG TPA: hypothetical protein VFE48_12720 [Methylomirabilota bacterium]|nr:hypothetical protein [Methylomirabilota bacterium]
MAASNVKVEEVTMVSYDDGGADVRAPWPLSWSGVWVGALASIALVVIFGLIGIAIGAHRAGHALGRWHDMGFLTLLWSVLAAFLSFAAGGWVAARIAGIRRSESGMLHGAIAWLVAVPFILALSALGASTYFGTWYGGLAGTPSWVTGTASAAQDPAAAIAARNGAVAAVTALLLGLVGSVVGGWMASGEPMTFTYYRTRPVRSGTGGW